MKKILSALAGTVLALALIVQPTSFTSTSQSAHAIACMPEMPGCIMDMCVPTANTACTSPANVCGETMAGIYSCTGICSAMIAPTPADTNENGTPDCLETTPECVENEGMSCTSTANVCGDTAEGTISCDGSCNASTPVAEDLNENGTADCLEPEPYSDLTITKTANVSSVQAGGQVTYTLTYTNVGNESTNNFFITDILPEGVQYVSSSMLPTIEGSNLSWYPDIELAPGASYTITVTVTTDARLSIGTTITNTAYIDSNCKKYVLDYIQPLESLIKIHSYSDTRFCEESSENNQGSVTVTIAQPTSGFGGGGGGGGYTPPPLLDTGAPTNNTGSSSTGSTSTGETAPTPQTEAYDFGKEFGLTTVDTKDARLEQKIIRGEVAKMLSAFYQKVLNQTIELKDSCDPKNYSDYSTFDTETASYIHLACSAGIMGWKNDKKTILDAFRPNDFITRAEFAAILSRILYNTVSDDNSDTWFVSHVNALIENKIIEDMTNPNDFETRGNVLIMLLNASKLLK